MFKILANIPFFVVPLFVVLLINGIKAKKTNRVPLKVLILFPAIFFCWSFSSFFNKYASDPLTVILWIICLGIGFCIGFFHIQRVELKFDRKSRVVEMPGSWIPLLLSMLIFITKFSVGMTKSMLPHLRGSLLFLGVELFSTILVGIFTGRALCCFLRYRSSDTENVKQDTQ